MTRYRFSDNATEAAAYGAVVPLKVWAEWLDSRGRPHLVETTWRMIGGRLEPVSFELRTGRSEDDSAPQAANLPPIGSAPPLEPRELRTISPGNLLREARRFVAASAKPSGPVEYDTLAGRLSALGDAARPQTSPNPTYERVANLWREAHRRGDPPSHAVRDAFGCSLDAARKKIQRARHAGYLPQEDAPTNEDM